MNRRFQINCLCVSLLGAAALTLAFASVSSAAIIGGTLSVSTLVQEMIDGVPASTTLDNAESDLLTGPLPVVATGELTSTDLDGALVSQGRGMSELSDPTRLNQSNPEEFRLESACYSNASNVAYVVNTMGTQRRDLIFTTPGSAVADPEIEFDGDGMREIVSSVFLSGAVMVWSTGSVDDLTGLEGDLQITITRDEETEPLFATSLIVRADGNGQLVVDTVGALSIKMLSISDLSGTGFLDDTSLSTLTSLSETGLLAVIAIEAQSHEYSYVVSGDVSFALTAQMVIDLRTPPGGVGIAATLGGPFEDLATFVSAGLSDVSGASVARAINAAAGFTINDEAIDRSPSLLPCGAFGVEALLGMLLPFATPVFRRRRRL